MSYVFMYNVPGCLPDMEPEEFDSFEEAKQACIEELTYAADPVEDEQLAEELTSIAEDVNLESGEFWLSAPDGYNYSVSEKFLK